MATDRSTWKKFERRVAAFTGCQRAVLSGSSGRDDATASDTTHKTLYIEAKLRETHAARTLHDATRLRAAKEGKLPVLALADKGRPGFLICVHSDDVPAVVAEWIAGLSEDEKDVIEGLIRAAYNRRHGIGEGV